MNKIVFLRFVRSFIVAIDGPAGSGKSTTARLVAEQLGFLYIDTGAMYRAATLAVLRAGVDVHNETAVETAVEMCTIAFNSNNTQQIHLNGEDVTLGIRDSDVTNAVSAVSKYKGVREKMVALQRGYAAEGPVVMDGRDIGTVVFPEANVKVFLSASLVERARRRLQELQTSTTMPSVEEVERQLAARDLQDSSRELSPLRKASDAIEIDTTGLTIDEQVTKVVELVKSKLNDH